MTSGTTPALTVDTVESELRGLGYPSSIAREYAPTIQQMVLKETGGKKNALKNVDYDKYVDEYIAKQKEFNKKRAPDKEPSKGAEGWNDKDLNLRPSFTDWDSNAWLNYAIIPGAGDVAKIIGDRKALSGTLLGKLLREAADSHTKPRATADPYRFLKAEAAGEELRGAQAKSITDIIAKRLYTMANQKIYDDRQARNLAVQINNADTIPGRFWERGGQSANTTFNAD